MPKTILVIDDEWVVVDITRRKLEELGYAVKTAYDGQQALAQLNQKIPDLILLDIQMPNMNGYTFLMEKGKTLSADVPVIVATAYGETEPLFRRHGVRAYLVKPLKPQDIIDKVKDVIGPAT